MAFRGQAEYSIDSKGRVAIPAKMRAAASEEKRFVALYGLDACLHLYPISTWEQKEADLHRLNQYRAENREAIRRLFMNTEDLETDAQGRVTLSKTLLDRASLTAGSTARILGAGERIEIWNPETLEEHLNKPSAESEILIDRTFGGL